MIAPLSLCEPRAGDAVRIYELAKQFGSLSELTLISGTPIDWQSVLVQDLHLSRHIHVPVRRGTTAGTAWRSIVLRRPYEEARSVSNPGPVPVALGDFDVAYLQLPRSWSIWRHLVRATRARHVVMDLQNDDSDVWRQRASVEKSHVLAAVCRIYERAARKRLHGIVPEISRFFCVSAEDRSTFARREGADVAAKTFVVPNGVNVETFRRPTGYPRQTATLVFVGSLDIRMNQLAVRELIDAYLPPLLTRFPEVRLTIAGRNPPIWLLRKAGPSIKVIASPPDVRPYLWSATASIVPFAAGGGSKIKVIEAMAAGTPVIATAAAMLGIPARPGLHYSKISSPADAVAIVEGLFADRSAAEELSRNAAAFAQRFDWALVARKALDLAEGNSEDDSE